MNDDTQRYTPAEIAEFRLSQHQPKETAMPKMTAEQWNDTYPAGQPVELTEDDGSITHTQTRSIAWELGHGEPVVKVDGKTGGYLLERIKAR